MSTEEKAAKDLLGEGWLIPLEHRAIVAQVVRLAHPVKHGGQVLDQVTLGIVRGVHARSCPSSWEDHDALLKMAGLLSGLPDVVLDQLEGGDLVAVIDATLRLCWPILELPAVGAQLEGALRRPWPEFPSPYTLVLERVARAGAEAASSLTFQPITGKIVRRLPNHLETRMLPRLIEALTGVRGELLDELEGVDLCRALGVAQCFFAATRPTTPRPGPS